MDDAATLAFTIFLFLEEGDITPTGTEQFRVEAGSVKFNIEVSDVFMREETCFYFGVTSHEMRCCEFLSWTSGLFVRLLTPKTRVVTKSAHLSTSASSSKEHRYLVPRVLRMPS